MGRKVLVVVWCWLALNEALGETEKKVNVSVIKDNESAESATKLYQKVYTGVYASGVPHGAYSVRVPIVIQPAASQLRQTSVVVPHATLLNSLKDSYGKFTESPHAAPYKTTFPQQFVQLQSLPPHLAQPLVSTASTNGVHYKSIPFFLSSQNYKVSEISASPTPFTGHSQPLVYAENVKSFAPNGPSHVYKFSSTPHHNSPHYISQSPSEFSSVTHYKTPSPTPSQDSVSKNPIDFSSTIRHKSPYRTISQHSQNKRPSELSIISHHKIPHHTLSQLSSSETPVEFYSIYPHRSSPQHSSPSPQQYTPSGQQHSDKGHISSAPSAHQPHQKTQNSQVASASDKVIKHENEQKASPVQTSVTTYVNGKKTVINIETKPPLPLLDLNLLEPLTFDNPLVPQMQHYLPKIETATYQKLPKFNVKNPKNYQKEYVVTKTKAYDSGSVKEKTHQDVPKKKQNKPREQNKPKVTVHGHPNGKEYSYEINSPNHKETYNEQVLKYNKQTDDKPVEYSYNEHRHEEPEVYSFVHNSKEPLKVTHVDYGSENGSPKHVVQEASPDNQRDNKENSRQPSSQEDEEQSEDESEESSTENNDDGPPPHAYQEEPPRYSLTEHHEPPENTHHNENKEHITSSNKDEHSATFPSTPQPFQHHSYQSSSSKSPPAQQRPENRHKLNEHRLFQELPKYHPQFKFHEEHFKVSQNDGEPKKHHPTLTPSHLLKAEHREQQKPNHEIKTEAVTRTPKYYSEPFIVHSQTFQPITSKYEEDIRLLRTHRPHFAPIKVDPNQHIQLGPVKPQTSIHFAYPSATLQQLPQQNTQQREKPHSQHEILSDPHIYEKSKQILIKEHEMTPDEMHKHMEEVVTQILDREENSEEDFEKAYKESAFGFPAYEKTVEDIEKDIYDPDSYGSPRFHYEYNGDDPTFQQYEKEGDKYPKSSRLSYKDERDNNQEEYYLDFSVNQPESFLDRHKSKVDYYKMYKKNRPGNIFSHINDDEDNKEKKSEKFVVEPSFDFGFGSPPATQKPKQSNLFARYTAAPIKYGFGYSKNAPRDSSAYASRPFHKYSRPVFIEPRFHYGFSPISAPLIDSELAAMASNVSPESEKAGMRKNIYKENWYIKKTSTTGSKPS